MNRICFTTIAIIRAQVYIKDFVSNVGMANVVGKCDVQIDRNDLELMVSMGSLDTLDSHGVSFINGVLADTRNKAEILQFIS